MNQPADVKWLRERLEEMGYTGHYPAECGYHNTRAQEGHDRYSDPLGLHTRTEESVARAADMKMDIRIKGLHVEDIEDMEMPVLNEVQAMADNHVRMMREQQEIDAEAKAKMELAESYGTDVYEDGTVFTFQREFNPGKNRVYRYACIKAQGFWFVTGSRHGKQTWHDLVTWLVTGVPATGWTRMVALDEQIRLTEEYASMSEPLKSLGRSAWDVAKSRPVKDDPQA